VRETKKSPSVARAFEARTRGGEWGDDEFALTHLLDSRHPHKVLTRLGPTIDPEDDYQRYVKGANILASLYGAK
jgi:hypothetical protein